MSMTRLLPGLDVAAGHRVGAEYDPALHVPVLVGFENVMAATSKTVDISSYGLAGYLPPIICYNAANNYTDGVSVNFLECTATSLSLTASSSGAHRLGFLLVGWRDR